MIEEFYDPFTEFENEKAHKIEEQLAHCGNCGHKLRESFHMSSRRESALPLCGNCYITISDRWKEWDLEMNQGIGPNSGIVVSG